MGPPTWGMCIYTLSEVRWPLPQSQITQSLPDSPTLPGGVRDRFRMSASNHPFYRRELSKVEPPGFKRTVQKSIPLGVVPT